MLTTKTFLTFVYLLTMGNIVRGAILLLAFSTFASVTSLNCYHMKRTHSKSYKKKNFDEKEGHENWTSVQTSLPHLPSIPLSKKFNGGKQFFSTESEATLRKQYLFPLTTHPSLGISLCQLLALLLLALHGRKPMPLLKEQKPLWSVDLYKSVLLHSVTTIKRLHITCGIPWNQPTPRVSSAQADMKIEQFDALDHAELDRKRGLLNLHGSKKEYLQENVSRFRNQSNLLRQMDTQNNRSTINIPEQNFNKKEHCHYCEKLSHYKPVSRKEIADDNRKNLRNNNYNGENSNNHGNSDNNLNHNRNSSNTNRGDLRGLK